MVKIYKGTLLNYMKGHVMSELAQLYIMLSCPSSFDIVKRGLISSHIPFQDGTYSSCSQMGRGQMADVC